MIIIRTLGKTNNAMLFLPNLFSFNQIFVSSNRVLISLFPEREMVSITVWKRTSKINNEQTRLKQEAIPAFCYNSVVISSITVWG